MIVLITQFLRPKGLNIQFFTVVLYFVLLSYYILRKLIKFGFSKIKHSNIAHSGTKTEIFTNGVDQFGFWVARVLLDTNDK